MKYLLVILSALFLSSCAGGCPQGCKQEEVPTKVSSSQAMLLQNGKNAPQAINKGPNVRVITIGPSKESEAEKKDEAVSASSSASNVPKEVAIDDALTSRLKDKLEQAFAGKGSKPPEIEIFTGNMSLDSFAAYYEAKGNKIQRTSVPASQVIAPLLEEKPELKDKVSASNYAGVMINQVIVEGANISAADKYIDPVTYEVVYKTFVTVTKTK